jgi:hypothetical protein
VFPPGRMHAPKVKAFVDFLSEHLVLDNAALRILCFQSATEECGHCAQQAEQFEQVKARMDGPVAVGEVPLPAEAGKAA